MSLTTFAPTASSVVPRLVLGASPVAAVQSPARSPTLAALIDDYMAAYTGRDKAMGWRLQVWRDRLGARPFAELTTSEIREALRQIGAEPARAWRGVDADGNAIHKVRKPRRSPGTVNRYHALLSGVLQWAIDEEKAPANWSNPARGIRRGRENPGVVRFLEDDERRRLLDACRASAWPKMYGLVLLALTSGARRGELLALRWRDVDLDKAIAYMRTTKNGDEGTLVLVPAMVEELRGYKRGKPEHFVFCSTRDPLRPYAIGQIWISVLRVAKVEKFRFHDLRHSFASALAQDGASLIEIADAMRHKTMAMVKRYAHLSARSRAALVNRVMGDVR
jgi:integrase